MRVMNNNKTLFESFQENLKEDSVDIERCKDAAEYYFNSDCQNYGDLSSLDYVDSLKYEEDEENAKKIEELIHDAWNIIKDHIYYDHENNGPKYIELSDNHTLWKIDNDKFPSDDYASDEYTTQVQAALEAFKDDTGVEIYCLGRSGRHVCVDLNYQNALNYSELVGKQQELEQSVIDGMNSWEPEEESTINEETNDLSPEYSNNKSFYGKAKVEDENGVKTLISYETPILKLEDGNITMLCKPEHLTQTTLRHVREFLQQNGLEPLSKRELLKLINESNLEEQDETVKVVTANQKERDYSITDITELSNVNDGDVQSPIDIAGLLVEVDERLTESVGEDWGQINFQSTRFNSDTKDSNALFELCVGDKTYLMSMLLEENGSLLKVNNTKGKTIFKRKTNDVTSLAESYIKQFIPITESEKEEKEDLFEKILSENTSLSDRLVFIKLSIEGLKSVDKDDKESLKAYIQREVYSFVTELGTEVKNNVPSDEYTTELPTFDKMVEDLFGKEWVKEVEEPEVKEVSGSETLTEDVKQDPEGPLVCPKCGSGKYEEVVDKEYKDEETNRDATDFHFKCADCGHESHKVTINESAEDNESFWKDYDEGVIKIGDIIETDSGKATLLDVDREANYILVERISGIQPFVAAWCPSKRDDHYFWGQGHYFDSEENARSFMNDKTLSTVNEASDIESEESNQPKQGLGTGYAEFFRKPKNINDLNDKSGKGFTDGDSSYLIVSKENLSKDEFDRIQDDFGATNDLCKAFEPIDSDGYAFNVIELSCNDYDYKLLVDPSGYDYCRYVAKVGGSNNEIDEQ